MKTELPKHLTIAARRVCLPVLRTLAPGRYTDAAPYRVLEIPTTLITHMQKPWHGALDLPWLRGKRTDRVAMLRRRWHAGIVLGGDWDLEVQSLDDYHLTRVLRARFEQGLDWREIPYVRRSHDKVLRGEPAWGGRCRTAADVSARCDYLDQLHESMRRHGYHAKVASAGKVRFTHFLVNVGRDGRIIRNNDGKHRILLAKILGIATIPARVLVRHPEWQQVRDAARLGRCPSDFRDHPDLRDLHAGEN